MILILLGAKRAICITVPDRGAVFEALLTVQGIELRIEVSTPKMVSIKLSEGGRFIYMFLSAPGLGAAGEIDFLNTAFIVNEARRHWRWFRCVHCLGACAERQCREGDRVM